MPRQRNLTKRKATRSLDPYADASGNLRCSQETEILETSRLRRRRTSKIFIRFLLRSSAQPGRVWGGGRTPQSRGTKRGWSPDQVRDDREKREPESESIPHPVEAGPSSADGGGRSGQTCLSRRRVVWTAAVVEQRRLPATKWRDPDVGSPSLCLLSLGEARESESPAGARPGLVVKTNH